MAFISKRDLPFLGFAGATLGLRILPRSLRFRWVGTASKGLAALWYRLDRSDAALTRRNLQNVLGSRLSTAEVEETARKIYRVVAFSKLVNDMLPSLPPKDLTQILRLEGEEHLQQALAQGRGAILLGTHFGLHGYIKLMLFKHLGYDVITAVKEEVEPDDSWVYRRIVHPIRSRPRRHFRVLTIDGTPQRAMVDCLRQNQFMLIYGDALERDMLELHAPEVLSVPLLDHLILLKTGPFRLARWLKSPILPLFVVPQRDGYTMMIDPPLSLADDNSVEGLAADLAAFTRRFEPHLLQHPALWAHWRHEDLLELMKPAREAVVEQSADLKQLMSDPITLAS